MEVAIEAASGLSTEDGDEDVDELSPDANDEVPVEELEKSAGDDAVVSAVKAVSTTTSPSLAVEVATTSLPNFVSDASDEADRLSSVADNTPAIPAHT